VEEREGLPSLTWHDRVEERGAFFSHSAQPSRRRRRSSPLILGMAEWKREGLSSPTRHGRIEEGGGALLFYSARPNKRRRRSSPLLVGTAK